MSWIFGCLSENINEDDTRKFHSIHGDPFYVFKNTSFYLTAGGNKNTIFTSKEIDQISNSSQGWLVSGIGLISDGQNQKLMSVGDWGKVLVSSFFDASKINGHFVVIIWGNESSIKIYSDLIGFRTIYLLRLKDKTVFSTELTWLTKFIQNPTINFYAFGSRWLTFNQLSHKCVINGIEKLPPAGMFEIDFDNVIDKTKNWIPQKIDATVKSFSHCLTSFLFPKSNLNFDNSFGLSGGLDSRTLLALALSETNLNPHGKFQVHTFGFENDDDVIIASKICNELKIKQTLLIKELIFGGEFLGKLSVYIKDTLLVEPASCFLKNIYFEDGYFSNRILIDGANGEIARRQFFNRLYVKGKSDLRNRYARNILKYLRMLRADIFILDVMKEMEIGCLSDVESIFEIIPSVQNIGVDRFLDLSAIKFRFPNYFGPEQSRLDKKIISYMPFSQISVIEQAFNLPLSLKKNSHLFYRLVSTHQPILEKFPLVKNDLIYPYGLNSMSAFLYTNLKKRFSFQKNSNHVFHFYHTVKDYVNDLISSIEVQQIPFYDYKKIRKLIDSYYAGNILLQSQVDWWFTFELWRRSLHIN